MGFHGEPLVGSLTINAPADAQHLGREDFLFRDGAPGSPGSMTGLENARSTVSGKASDRARACNDSELRLRG
jgi:hypothetical protein